MTTILLIAGLVVIAGGAIWGLARYAMKRGRAEVQRDAAKGSADAGRKARTIEDQVRRMDGAALDDELRGDRDND